MDSAPPEEQVRYMAYLLELEQAGQWVPLMVGPASAMALASACQWAARNPGLASGQRRILRGLVDQLRPFFAGTLGEEILNQGDHPEWDVPQD